MSSDDQDFSDKSFQDAWKEAAKRKPVAPSVADARVVANALERIEIARRDLAQVYATAEGGTTLEHEVGESLTKLRVAAKRLRLALGNVAQMRMDMETPA